MKNYRLFLFKPTAINYPVDWTSSDYRELLLGELKVDNLKTSIKLQDISTINFDLPETIFGELNPRINEVLDNYIVELWYGDLLDPTNPTNPTSQRFIIIKSPLEYDNGVKKYCYEGSSIEHTLEFKQLLDWEGILVKDFYRTIFYDPVNNRFTETPSFENSAPTYTINTSTQTVTGQDRRTSFITVPTTTSATEPPLPFDIFIYQNRRDDTDTLNSESSLIEYEQNVPSGTLHQNTSGFKPGFYVPVVNANGKVTSINIALPKDFREFNSSSKVLEFFLYDNPISRHFAIGVNTDEEIEASDMYLDLAQDVPVKFSVSCNAVADSNILVTRRNRLTEHIFIGQKVTQALPANTKITNIERISTGVLKITISNNYTGLTGERPFQFESSNAAEFGNFAFTPQLVYSINGLKLQHILTGNVENSTINEDGILFNTGFTIGNIHEDIAIKYRSNIELNNITKYEAIKSLAESFDSIVIFNSINKTVSFFPDKNEEAFDNNGLIITKENYLKSLTNDIDSSKIITKAFAAGKDNLSLSLITPNGGNAWEDYSYFLDTFYVEYDRDNLQAMTNSTSTGVSFSSFPNGTLSRWMDSTEALKIAQWQYARDYFHDILLGELDPTISEHDKYYDLYNLRSAAINDFVKEETKFFELKAVEYKYKYLYDFYVKQNDNLENLTRQKNFVYKFNNNTTVADPGSTFFRLNNASLSSVTKIIIDNIDNTSINIRAFLIGITSNNNPEIVLTDVADFNNGDPTNFVFYKIDSIDTADAGYVVLNVTHLGKTQAGDSFTNNNTINLKFLTWEEIYDIKYDEALAESTLALENLDILHYKLYNTRFDGSVPISGDPDFDDLIAAGVDSFATKILQIQNFLTKSTWTIDEEELAAFTKEAIVSDSNLDNELDLLTMTEEYLVENSKPVITLAVNVVDFLASTQSSVDWNKAEIGDIVNIYFPDFNIDTTAQLREISIDFQSNSLSFVISTYRQYTRIPMTFIMRQIRRGYNNQTNKFSYQHDKTVKSDERANIVNKQLNKIGFAAELAPIRLGAKSQTGETSTEISGDGFVSRIINVDPILETFVYKNEKTLTIADGTLTARNFVRDNNEVPLYTTEVEVSGDNGFVIRKVDIEGIATKQVYIDTNGNASFAGNLVAPSGDIGGFTIANNFLRAGTVTGTAVGMSPSIANNISFYAGALTTSSNPPTDAQINAAPFRVTNAGVLNATGATISGNITADAGNIGGFSIDANSIKAVNDTTLLLRHDATNPFLSIKQSTNGYGLDGIFLGVATTNNITNPKFSMVTDSGNTFFKYDPSADFDLEIAGNAKIGPLFLNNTQFSISDLNTSNSGLTYFSGASPITQLTGGATLNLTDQSGQEIVGGTVIISISSGVSITTTITLFSGINGTGTNLGSFESENLVSLNGSGGLGIPNYGIRNVKSFQISIDSNLGATYQLLLSDIELNSFKPSIQINDFTVTSSGQLSSSQIKLSPSTQNPTRDTLLIQPAAVGSSRRFINLTTPATALTSNRTITLPDATGTLSLLSLVTLGTRTASAGNGSVTISSILSFNNLLFEFTFFVSSNRHISTLFIDRDVFDVNSTRRISLQTPGQDARVEVAYASATSVTVTFTDAGSSVSTILKVYGVI